MKLKDKVAIVTGAGRGLGREIALAYAEEGAHLVLAARTSSEIQAVGYEVRTLGRKALVIPTNVALEEDVNQMVEKALREFGRIDILVNNAGIGFVNSIQQLRDTDLKEWQTILDINSTGTFLCCKAVLGTMIEQKSGVILNMSSALAGKMCHTKTGPYAASKAAIEALTRVLAAEVAPFNIRVNAVLPDGPMATSLLFGLLKDFETPVSRLLRPDAIRPLAIHLASQDSAGVTGQCLSATEWIEEHGPGTVSDYIYSEKAANNKAPVVPPKNLRQR